MGASRSVCGEIFDGPADLGGVEAASGVRLPWVLRVFWVASVVWFGLAVMRAWWGWRVGLRADEWNPLAGAWFADLMEYVPVFRLVHTAGFWAGVEGSRVAYPPFGAVMFAGFYATGRPVVAYLAMVVVGLVAAGWGVRRRLVGLGIGREVAGWFVGTVVVTSFPIWGMVQRGNIELVVWGFCAAGVWAWWRGRDDLAAVLWGLAAGVKLYPVVLLVLLLPRRRLRAFGAGVGTFVGVSVASMVWLGPSLKVAWRGAVANVFGYQGVRVGEWSMHELAANHSAFGWVKVLAVVFGWDAGRLVMGYYCVGAVVFAAMFFGRLWRMPRANQLLGVSVFMVMLPVVSYFYSLVHLYAVWVVLVFVAVRASRDGVRVRGLGVAMVMFVGVFGSFTLLTWRGVWMFGGLVQACLLGVLFVCAGLFPFGEGGDLDARLTGCAEVTFGGDVCVELCSG
jgi:Glycosyltransferase family 87